MSLIEQMQQLRTHETDWNPKSTCVSLNVCTEACIVPTDADSARLSFGHVVVLDDFFTEEMRKEIFESVNRPGWEDWQPPSVNKWQKATCDQAGMPPTWGLKDAHLKELLTNPCEAIEEVQSRLCKLYPEVTICHMPSEQIQSNQMVSDKDVDTEGKDEEVVVSGYDCDKFVGNAAVCGDVFSWHVDADPWTFDEDSKWAKEQGIYFNGEPGKPLFVSLLIYLNAEWEREWDAETLFLDSHTDTGFFVRPKNGRAVLMDQDILHRLSPPSPAADRPRYSLVWKLVFLPKNKNQTLEISKREWGQPTYFGSAARAKAVRDYLF